MEYTYTWIRLSSAQYQKLTLCNIKRVHNKVAKHQIPCPLLKTDGILPFSYYPYAFNTVSGSDAEMHCCLLPSQPCSSQAPLQIRADIWAVQIVDVSGWKEQDRDRGRRERKCCLLLWRRVSHFKKWVLVLNINNLVCTKLTKNSVTGRAQKGAPVRNYCKAKEHPVLFCQNEMQVCCCTCMDIQI